MPIDQPCCTINESTSIAIIISLSMLNGALLQDLALITIILIKVCGFCVLQFSKYYDFEAVNNMNARCSDLEV
jgi:hypothetical protein